MAERFEHHAALFSARFRKTPDRAFFSPGRINLIGEHTDYNGGWVLPAAVHLGSWFLARGRADPLIRVYSSKYDDEVEVKLRDLDRRKPEGRWSDYFIGVLRELPERGSRGMDVLVASTLPVGSGLSSSASITTGFATLLNDFWDLSIPRERLVSTAQAAENRFVGVACGVLDPFAVAMGREGHVMALNCTTMQVQYVPFPSRNYAILAIDSDTPRSLGKSGYNVRRAECARALAAIRERREAATLSDVTLSDLEQIDLLQREPVLFRRARHVISENQRVNAAVAALVSGRIDDFGEQLLASHASLRDDYEVSCAEIDTLVDESTQIPGVVGAKITGGGFGGCAVAVVERPAIESVIDELGERYRRKVGRSAAFHVCHPADGAGRVRRRGSKDDRQGNPWR